MNGLDVARIHAVTRKELRDYRRKRSIVVTMAVLPIVFLIEPIVTIFLAPVPTGSDLNNYVILPLLYMLLIPVIMPATLAAYTVVGEREQGTLEPLLGTPTRTQEFILGKASAIMIPSVVLSYAVFGLFLAAVRLFANSIIASAVFHEGPVILAQFLFAPLLGGWAILVGMAISVRASEVRVAQQLGTLASLPPVGAIMLLSVGVVHPTFTVAVLFALGLVAIDALALRVVSSMFDRERLVTGAKSVRGRSLRRFLVSRSAATPMTGDRKDGRSTNTSTLHLTRTSKLLRGIRPWKVVVDGAVVGSISTRQRTELPIEPGRHSVRVESFQFLSSPERSFEIGEGEAVGFSCRVRPFGALVVLFFILSLFKHDLWIILKPDSII